MQDINAYLDTEMVRRSRDWQALKDSLILALPPNVLPRVVYASIEETTLTIFCDSPVWTSKMRFYDSEIIKVFKQRGIVVRAVKARTVPAIELRE